jgi:diguanylate cyclase (GGDEF)-like protein
LSEDCKIFSSEKAMSPAETAPCRLLVVDDNEDNRALLARRLTKRGYEVVEADCGPVALQLISEQDFDLVLLDIMMPGIDGIEVLKTIRLTRSPDHLPVLMVTAKAGITDIVEALELGANDYIVKPIEFSTAFARIRTQIARKQAQQAVEQSLQKLVKINQELEIQIAERNRSDAKSHYLTYHDALTGLGNRLLFQDQLARALQRARDQDRANLAVLFIDVDDFKGINDTLGHTVGDVLLATVAERLRRCVREADTVARMGSDEFAVILTDIRHPLDASLLADKIAAAIAVPQNVGGQQILLDVSIGIALAPNDGDEPELLLSNAHLALQGAKTEGRDARCFFEAEMNARARARRLLKTDLRKALAAGQFELFYQPLFNIPDRAISGFEALLRWHHPDRGLISPAEFIPLAEESGLIVPLGEWVLRQACEEAARWPGQQSIAVNISPVQFRSPRLMQCILTALTASGMPAHRLELEITETVLLDDDSETIALLHRLRDAGVRISLDDFGTGYSSLGYLRRFPFDKMKIDRSFVRDLGDDKGTMAIVRALIDLARNLGMVTTAEGVETKEQLDWLQNEHCTEIQGYLLSRPVPATEIRQLLQGDQLRSVA